MQLGRWQRGGPDEAPQPVGATIAHAVHHVASEMMGGGWGGLSGLRARRLLRDAVIKTFGGAYFHEGVQTVVGMRQGKSVQLGCCRNAQGRLLRFDFWLPHFGIAIDLPTDADEVACKDAWCAQHGISYAHVGSDRLMTGGTLIDHGWLAQLAERIRERREQTLRTA